MAGAGPAGSGGPTKAVVDWGDPDSEAVSRVIPGEYVVRLRPGVRVLGGVSGWPGVLADKIAVRPLGPAGVRGGGLAGGGGGGLFRDLYHVVVLPGVSPEAVVMELRSVSSVLYVEANTVLEVCGGDPQRRYPDDFRFPEQWALENTGQKGGVPGSDVRAPAAWSVTTGDPSVRVAVIDTGIDYFHPDLESNVWVNPGEVPANGVDDDGNGYIDDVHGYDFVSRDSDPLDDQMHGTHVAGIIGAVGDNRMGVSGVCWRVSLMALKAFNEAGEATLADVLESIHYAVANGAQIINASWGQPDKSRALADAVAAAHAAGVVLVASAGNDRSDRPYYPASYPEAVTVAATNAKDERSLFSNYGYSSDLAAPGEAILSTVLDNRYDSASGTSMAAPHVAGAAALVWSLHPGLGNRDVEDILRNATDPIASTDYVGSGRLNLHRALAFEVPLARARLEVPAQFQGRMDVMGTAAGDRFERYVVEYGDGTYPAEWTRLFESDQPVAGGALIRDFRTDRVPEGAHVLRLRVRDRLGQEVIERTNIVVRNVTLSAPAHNDVIRWGERVEIRGTVFGSGRTYRIEHGQGLSPQSWSSAGIELANGGQLEVMGGRLATWDTGVAAPDEFHRVRLTALAGGRVVGESVLRWVYLDRRLRPGFPVQVPLQGGYYTNDWRHVVCADLDRDGTEEIVGIGPGNSEGADATLRVYGADGSLRWMRSLPVEAAGADIPVVGDLDGDGFLEVLVDVNEAGDLHAFRHDGAPVPGAWPVRTGLCHPGKVMADLDGDGRCEVILVGQVRALAFEGARDLLVLDATGAVIRRWRGPGVEAPPDVPRQLPAVGDLDEDPDLEIVAVFGGGELRMYDLDEPDGLVWRAATAGTIHGSPVVGDLDGDRQADVAVAVYDSRKTGKTGTRGGLYAFDRHGRLFPGWPVLVDESFSGSPALADLDGNESRELILAGWDTKRIYALGADGFLLPGWPVEIGLGRWLRTSPAVGDLDGDGRMDVVVVTPGFLSQVASSGSTDWVGGVVAWSGDGTPIDLHTNPNRTQLVMESSGGSRLKAATPLLTDLDGDGRLDVVATTVEDAGYPGVGSSVFKQRYSIYAWALDAPAPPWPRAWPMFQHDPQRSGYTPSTKPPSQPPVLFEIPSQIIRAGTAFFPIELDYHVADPDTAREELIWSVSGGGELLVTVDADRVLRVAPPGPGWIGSETVQVVVRDPAGGSSEAAVAFSVREDYEPPLAVEDAGMAIEDEPIAIDVTANDTHPQGLPLSVLSVSRARHGQTAVNPDGAVAYWPAADDTRPDAFTYVVTDGAGGLALGRVLISITPMPDPPVAVEDRAITLESQPVVVAVLENDSDADGDAVRVSGTTQPGHGRVEPDGGGGLVYHPDPSWWGADHFEYTVTDDHGGFAVAPVAIQVKPVNDPPVARALAYTLNRNTEVTVIFQGDDPEGDALTYTVVQAPLHGELWNYPTIAPYYPGKGFSGTDSIAYTASDAEYTSAPALVTLNVLDANNAPRVEDATWVTKVGRPLAFDLVASDVDDDPLEFSVLEPPLHGSVKCEGSNVVYAPDASHLGADRFTWQARDAPGATARATVHLVVTSTNTAPVAEGLSLAVNRNQWSPVRLLAHDPENDPLRYTVVTNPAQGELSGVAPNFDYLPRTNYYGPDRFAFRVDDGEYESEIAVVFLDVVHPNRRPDSRDQSVSTVAGTRLELGLDVTDADGDALRRAVLKGPAHGRVWGAGTTLVYEPAPEFTGQDTFTYRVWDGLAYGPITRVEIRVDSLTPLPPPEIEAIKRLEDGSVQLRIRSAARFRLQIERSGDLRVWSRIGEVTPAEETVLFLDTQAAPAATLFYRAARE